VSKASWLVVCVALVLVGLLLLAPAADTGRPFTPSSAAEVLEQVPQLRVTSADAGSSADDAAALAKALIEESRRSGGDPRLLGQAQAALGPWWNEPTPPSNIRLLRATLKQSLHDFDGALVDLDVLATNPIDVQAQLTRATVLQVLARYDEAEACCMRLRGQVDDVVSGTCLGPLLGIRGKAEAAASGLIQVLTKTPRESPLRSWGLSVLAELLLWAGKQKEATVVLREVLTLDVTDAYSRGLLSETLVEQGLPNEAVTLFDGRTLNDAELLHLVLALRAAKAPAFEARREELAERVEASRRRGDVVHRREESRYALALEGDVPRALALAVANYQVQKEPADARVLLEAAAAAKDVTAAKPALDWLKATGFEDPTVRALAKSLEGP
jgi:hypothetical protein